MNAQDVYQLVKSLSADEKRIMNDILIQFAGRTKSKLIDLFGEMYKLREWKEDSEQRIRKKLGMDVKEFYKNRFNLGLRMLQSFPRLNNGEWNLGKMFEIALEKGHLRDLTKFLMESIREQVENENWALAIELQEIAEDFARRHGSDKYLDGLVEMDETLVYAEAFRQERYFRSGLRRYRKSLKLDMNQRKFIAKSMESEFEGMEPLSEKAQYLKDSLMARIPLLGGDVGRAADLEVDLVKGMLLDSERCGEEFLDEIAFLIVLLLGLDREHEAKYFTMKLSYMSFNDRNLQRRKKTLEIRNLLAIANQSFNLEFNSKAFDKLVLTESLFPKSELAKLYYAIALTYFYTGNYRKCNLVINKIRSLDLLKTKVLYWQRESLALLSCFARNDVELVDVQLRIVKKICQRETSEMPQMIYDTIEFIERKGTSHIPNLILDLIEKFSKFELRNSLSYIDLVSFLKAFNRGLSVSEYLKGDLERLQKFIPFTAAV